MNKRVEIGLTYIYGIGRPTSAKLLAEVGVEPDRKVRDLTESEVVKLERFRQIVVGTRVEPDHPVFLLSTGGKHDYRHGAVLAKLPQYFKPVQNRHHDVQNHQIELAFQCARHPAPAIVDRFDFIAIRLEKIAHQSAQIGIIVH